jgi:diketogulonate reductase-like aldo/keto reductase
MHRVSGNGADIPAIGLGTWELRGEAATRCVATALGAGYRHIDTASSYDNAEAVGEGLRIGGVPRGDVFLTTKVWPTDIAEGDLQRSVEASLKSLAVDYVDLALIHWPSKTVPLAESIKALNEVHARGLARNIGVSNFTVALVEEAVALSDRPLACNQVEYHPYLNQDRVLAACRRNGLAFVSYCPLASGSDPFAQPAIVDAATAHGKTPAQITLRWHVQQESVVAIPRSQNDARIGENFDVFDFELTDAEMAAINALQLRRLRICENEFSPGWDRD